jgi:hypothetical protein
MPDLRASSQKHFVRLDCESYETDEVYLTKNWKGGGKMERSKRGLILAIILVLGVFGVAVAKKSRTQSDKGCVLWTGLIDLGHPIFIAVAEADVTVSFGKEGFLAGTCTGTIPEGFRPDNNVFLERIGCFWTAKANGDATVTCTVPQ